MKSLLLQATAVIGLVVAVSAPGTTQAQHKCDRPVSAIDRRACDQAADGADALRRFVTRTRMIYALDIYDYLRDREPAPGSASATGAARPAHSYGPEARPTTTARRAD